VELSAALAVLPEVTAGASLTSVTVIVRAIVANRWSAWRVTLTSVCASGRAASTSARTIDPADRYVDAIDVDLTPLTISHRN